MATGTVNSLVSTLNSNLENLVRSVLVGGRINENGLSAGDNGYIPVEITIPTGYKATGLATISLGHPGTAGGLVLTTGVSRGQTGTATIYVSYYTPHAISNGAHTDFSIIIQCIKSSSILS